MYKKKNRRNKKKKKICSLTEYELSNLVKRMQINTNYHGIVESEVS